MEEARRAVGRNLQEEMVANERAKIKEARQAPRKMKKHVNAWAGFEVRDIDCSFMDARVAVCFVLVAVRCRFLVPTNRIDLPLLGGGRERLHQGSPAVRHPLPSQGQRPALAAAG